MQPGLKANVSYLFDPIPISDYQLLEGLRRLCREDIAGILFVSFHISIIKSLYTVCLLTGLFNSLTSYKTGIMQYVAAQRGKKSSRAPVSSNYKLSMKLCFVDWLRIFVL
jgi:hypothetical protein